MLIICWMNCNFVVLMSDNDLVTWVYWCVNVNITLCFCKQITITTVRTLFILSGLHLSCHKDQHWSKCTHCLPGKLILHFIYQNKESPSILEWIHLYKHSEIYLFLYIIIMNVCPHPAPCLWKMFVPRRSRHDLFGNPTFKFSIISIQNLQHKIFNLDTISF